MTAIEVITALTRLGFSLRLDGEAVKVRFIGQDKINQTEVAPLLATLKVQKEEVQKYLTKPQAPIPPDRLLSCADCGFHKYHGPNPREGFGRCTFKEMGCYGFRVACEHVQPSE